MAAAQVIRLSPEAYRALEKSLTGPIVTTSTTDLLAGYQLGVQAALKALREGYVVE